MANLGSAIKAVVREWINVVRRMHYEDGEHSRLVIILVVLIALMIGLAYVLPKRQHGLAAPRSQVVLLDIPGTGNGSGIVIAPGKILTAAHVATYVANGLLAEPGKVPTKVLKEGEPQGDTGVDLAVLSAKVNCPCAVLADSPPKPDEQVIVIGFPHNSQLHLQVLTRGYVQGIVGHELVLTAPAAGGNSGGGVFVYRDGEWQLVGVLVSTLGQGGDGPMPVEVPVNYLTIAMELDTIKKFISGV